MVYDHDNKSRSRKRSNPAGQAVYGPPPAQPDTTRPLGPVPSPAYGRWGEELERQRMQAASRSAAAHHCIPCADT